MLRAFVSRRRDKLLPLMEFAYNNSEQASTKQTPFYLNSGRHSLLPVNLDVPPNRNAPTAQALAQHLRNTLERAQAHIAKSQERQAHQANKRRTVLEFQVGDQVLLSRRNLRHGKLDAVWLGTLSHHRAHLPHSLSPGATCRHADEPSLPRFAPEAIQGRAAHSNSTATLIYHQHKHANSVYATLAYTRPQQWPANF